MVEGQGSCIYRAYENGELAVTGRLTLDDLPEVGDVLRLNNRPYVVRAIDYDAGEPVLSLEPE